MAVTIASVLLSVDPQVDARRQVHERHTDSLGAVYERFYLADAVSDLNAAMAAYGAGLLANAPLAEIANNLSQVTQLGSLAVVTFAYSTVAANAAAVRLAYQSATQLQAVMIGDFLSSLTDAQIEAAFGLTAGQTATLRTNKLTTAASQASAIRASVGQ